MIYLKIYFTLIIVILAIAGYTWSLANSDKVRKDLWFKISYISWITLFVMLLIGSLVSIWVFPLIN